MRGANALVSSEGAASASTFVMRLPKELIPSLYAVRALLMGSSRSAPPPAAAGVFVTRGGATGVASSEEVKAALALLSPRCPSCGCDGPEVVRLTMICSRRGARRSMPM